MQQQNQSDYPVRLVVEIECLSPESSLARYLEANFAGLEKSTVKGSLAQDARAWRQFASEPELLAVVEKGYYPHSNRSPWPFFARIMSVQCMHSPSLLERLVNC